MTTSYDKEVDVLNIEIAKGIYYKSIELGSIIIDVTKDGKILSFEILQASKVFAGVKEVIKHAEPITA